MSRRPAPKPPTVGEASQEYRDAAKWQCASCNAPIEPGQEYGRFCMPCGSYWRDIENGLFEDDDDWEFDHEHDPS